MRASQSLLLSLIVNWILWLSRYFRTPFTPFPLNPFHSVPHQLIAAKEAHPLTALFHSENLSNSWEKVLMRVRFLTVICSLKNLLLYVLQKLIFTIVAICWGQSFQKWLPKIRLLTPYLGTVMLHLCCLSGLSECTPPSGVRLLLTCVSGESYDYSYWCLHFKLEVQFPTWRNIPGPGELWLS